MPYNYCEYYGKANCLQKAIVNIFLVIIIPLNMGTHWGLSAPPHLVPEVSFCTDPANTLMSYYSQKVTIDPVGFLIQWYGSCAL